MTNVAAQFSTVVLRRSFEAPPDSVYEALVDDTLRQRLSRLGEDFSVVLEESDVRVGGRDLLRFGPRTNPRFQVTCIYHDIVPGQRVVATEVMTSAGQTICVTLATWEVMAKGAGAELKITASLVMLDPSESSDAPRMRYETALDAIGRFLDGVRSAAGEG